MIMIVWIIVIGFIVLKLATSAYNPPKNRKNKHHYSDSGSSGYTDSGWSFWGGGSGSDCDSGSGGGSDCSGGGDGGGGGGD